MLVSSESGLQCTLNGFAAAYDIAGIKMIAFKTKALNISRNSVQCYLQVGRVLLKQMEKFEYLWVAFVSDGGLEEELDVRLGKVSAVLQALHYFFLVLECEHEERQNSQCLTQFLFPSSSMVMNFG